MKSKVVVITGATSGIGQVAEEKLAAMGARIVIVARNPARAELTVARLRAIAPGVAHRVHYADLSRLADTKRVAKEIASAEPKIDVLINNAGALFGRRESHRCRQESVRVLFFGRCPVRSIRINNLTMFPREGLYFRHVRPALLSTPGTPKRCHAVGLLDAAPEHVCVLPGRDPGDARAGFVFAGKLLS